MNVCVALDIDGVINEFSWDAGGHVGRWAKPECLAELDRLIDAADADVVLSSTWRGLVHDGLMTPRGFGAMLATHGFQHGHRVVGVTAAGPIRRRGEQIREWWRANPQYDRVVAIDDMELGHQQSGIPLVQTDGRVGLTALDADRVISLLKGGH